MVKKVEDLKEYLLDREEMLESELNRSLKLKELGHATWVQGRLYEVRAALDNFGIYVDLDHARDDGGCTNG